MAFISRSCKNVVVVLILAGIMYILTFCLDALYTQVISRQPGSASVVSQDEVRHIAFLRVHKAASTTIQNIIYRFGMKRNLTFVLAKDRKQNYVSLNVHNMMPLHPPPPGGHYDILCNHAVFNEKSFKALLPNDTVYIAVVREPLERFISAAMYYRNRNLAYLRGIPTSDHMWLDLLRDSPLRYDKGLYSYTRNSMAKDFGFQLINTNNRELINKYLAHLGHIFDFVLIKEYFDESIVLMKRLFRWSFQDVIYLSRNVKGTGQQHNLTETDREIFRKTNFLDIMIYDFFLQKYFAKIKNLDKGFKSEVSAFKQVLSEVRKFCSDSPKDVLLEVPSCSWSASFTVTRQDCVYMKMEGLDFLKIIQAKQGMFEKSKQTRMRV